jgi:cytochrome c553
MLAALALTPTPQASTVGAPPPAQACTACHGADGVSAFADVPNLAGQKAEYLAQQLKAFRDGARKHDLMQAVARQLGDDDIRALATYWGAAPAAGSGQPTGHAAATISQLKSRMRMPAGFPAGFRDYWRRVDERTRTIDIAHANGVAWQAASHGQELPDGSIIVVVTHDATLGTDGRWTPGAVRAYSAMERQAGWGSALPELLRNANWHYGLFTASGTPRLDIQRLGMHHQACLACHKPLATQSYLFTWPDLLRASKAARLPAPN